MEDWLKFRGYVHFDLRAPLGGRSGQRLVESVTSPAFVKSHSFYPFIRRNQISRTLKKDVETDKRRVAKKTREISYSAHLDSHIYGYYSYLIGQCLEEEYTAHRCSESVLAYRSLDGKCNIEFAFEVFALVERSAPCTVLCYDVTDFFGSLSHQRLKCAWAAILRTEELSDDHYAVFKAITRHSWVDYYKACQALELKPSQFRDNSLKRLCSPQDFRTKIRGGGLVEMNSKAKGIPQGSPISAVLSNLYMLEADKVLSVAVAKLEGRYFRYSDDILLVVPDERKAEASALVERALRELDLTINEQKVDEVLFQNENGKLDCNRPLNYLGFSFDGNKILIRPQTLTRYYRKMKRAILAIRARDYEVGRRFKIPKKKLYKNYSHLGKRNFISYAKRAHKAAGERSGIARQIRKHFRILKNLIDQLESP